MPREAPARQNSAAKMPGPETSRRDIRREASRHGEPRQCVPGARGGRSGEHASPPGRRRGVVAAPVAVTYLRRPSAGAPSSCLAR